MKNIGHLFEDKYWKDKRKKGKSRNKRKFVKKANNSLLGSINII